MKKMKIGSYSISEKDPAFIIAELSCNHLQNYELAEETVLAIKEAGADAVKLQTYTPDTITLDSDNDIFKINHGTIWDSKTFYELYKDTYTPWEWQPKLKKLAESIGLECFSSPFDKTSVDFLEEMDVPAYKIASFEITDIPLIKYIASKNKPIILSTGIAELEDIRLALETIYSAGNNQVALLKCTSAYPAKAEEANLLCIKSLAKEFDVLVGISDHTLGDTVPVVSVALGAKIIEKHFILNRADGGADAEFSMEPHEFKQMVQNVRTAEAALGDGEYQLSKRAMKSREFARSLFIVSDVKKGETITENSLRSIRPSGGMHPKYFDEIIGQKAVCDIKKGTPASFELFERCK